MAYLGTLLFGYRYVSQSGSLKPQRSTLNFTGSVTVTDNPGTGVTDVDIGSGGLASAITDLVADVVAVGPGTATAEVRGIRSRAVASTAPVDGSILIFGDPVSTWSPQIVTGDAELDKLGVLTVTGLQGFPISTTAPISGDVLSWDAGNGWWEPGAGGGGGITALTGDVTAGPGTGSQVASIAAGVIVDADVNAGAAIAGTKVAPDFGSQDVVTTGFVGIGATPRAASGGLRLKNNPGSIVAIRDNTNSSDWAFLGTAGVASGFVGNANVDFSVNGFSVTISSAGTLSIFANSQAVTATNTTWQLARPQIGFSTAWGSVNGKATQAMADANQTPVAAVYQCTRIETTGGITADRDLVLPQATDAQGYMKIITNSCTSGGPFGIVVKAGASGTTVTIALSKTAIVWIDSAGVTRITADA